MPAKQRLTELTVKQAAAPKTGRLEYFDDAVPGFALRVTAKGTKSWTLLYKFGGKSRRVTLGQYPTVSLKAARGRARKAHAQVLDGMDPAAEKRRQRRESVRHASNTFGAVAERFMREYERGEGHTDGKRGAKPLHRTWKETQQLLDRYVLPRWRNVPIGEITRADVIELRDAVKANSIAQANKTFAIVRKLYAWALDKDLVGASPCVGVKKAAVIEPRNRPLKDDEIRAFWNACEGLGYPYGHAYRLLLVTAQRRNEVCRMTRSELDLDAAEWELSAQRTKANRRHVVPLSELALELLHDAPQFKAGQFVFSTTAGKLPINGFSKATDRLRAIAEREAEKGKLPKLENFRLHDLRETAATVMRERLGVSLDVLGQVLNHAPQTVTEKHYASAHSVEAKRRALDAWDRYLQRVIGREVENVVELRKSATTAGI